MVFNIKVIKFSHGQRRNAGQRDWNWTLLSVSCPGAIPMTSSRPRQVCFCWGEIFIESFINEETNSTVITFHNRYLRDLILQQTAEEVFNLTGGNDTMYSREITDTEHTQWRSLEMTETARAQGYYDIISGSRKTLLKDLEQRQKNSWRLKDLSIKKSNDLCDKYIFSVE